MFVIGSIGRFKLIPSKMVRRRLGDDRRGMKINDAKSVDITAETKTIENEINLLVYHLYGLTYDEALVVDPETSITRQEYERE